MSVLPSTTQIILRRFPKPAPRTFATMGEIAATIWRKSAKFAIYTALSSLLVAAIRKFSGSLPQSRRFFVIVIAAAIFAPSL